MVRYEILHLVSSCLCLLLTCVLITITVMLNENGYCVVVDMGFAKVVMDKTYTMCG